MSATKSSVSHTSAKEGTPPELKPARAHEVTGRGAVFFALMQAAQRQGPVLWLREGWKGPPVLPAGVAPYFDPHRLLFARTPSQLDTLAVTEEALRAGAVPLVIFEADKEISLKEGRRLQLAAKEGNATALGLIAEGQGSNAAETRWRCSPVFDPDDAMPVTTPDVIQDSTLNKWEIIKNKSGTFGSWHVRWDHEKRGLTAHRLSLVSPLRK